MAQSEAFDWSERTSLLLYVGWPKGLTTAFAENQICPSDQAREFGVGVSVELNHWLGLELGGSRFFAHDHHSCVNGHIWPPEEGPYTYKYTTPTESTRGYPFSNMWGRLALHRPIFEDILGRVYAGVGFVGSKRLPFVVSGFSGEARTGRVRPFLEYEVAWYRVHLEEVELQFMDGLQTRKEVSDRKDPHRSAFIRLGLRIGLGARPGP